MARLAGAGDVAEDSDPTRRRCDRPGDAAEDRGFPGAVRPADGESLAPVEHGVELFQDVASAKASPEPLDQECGLFRAGSRYPCRANCSLLRDE